MAESKSGPLFKKVDFLPESGEMADLVRAKDWSATPLGPIEQWPQSLRTTVSLCLASNFPINIIWGPENTQIYNDGYRVVCGEGHPAFLGMDYSVSWASAWPAVGEPFARARAGDTSFLENQRMFLHRNGYLEETFFTFSTSPIRDESGGIGGLFHPVTETTASMLGERRTRAIRDLTACLAQAGSITEVFDLTVRTLANFAFDLPFVLLYRVDAGSVYRLAGVTGIAAGTGVSPAELDPVHASPWPLSAVMASQQIVRVPDFAGCLNGVACGPYDEPPDQAFVIPIRLPGSDVPAAFIMAGASPRLPLDDVYRGFYDLIAAAFSAGLANAYADEDERKRLQALAEIDQAKTAFFSNVSHEFRTPLTLMLGPLSDALDDADALEPQQRERLLVAHRNALRLLKLVNSLLDFSRIEAGRAQAGFEPVDLAAVTSDLASNFRSACERAGLSFAIETPPLGEPVYIDRDMWEKIVLNLLSNAFKFTLKGGITVTLTRAGEAAELTVSDSGVGIPADELPRVFERFHRIEGQQGRTHEGTGIGLALVDELVKLHGGRISAASTVGTGTVFTVSLPFGTAHLPKDRIQAVPSLASTAIRANAFVEEALRWLPDSDRNAGAGQGDAEIASVEGRPRIILADDNADMRGYVTRILEQGGYEVDSVADGLAVLALLRTGARPDLILTDVMMPGLDGFGLLKALRDDPAMEGLLVILLSARAGEEARVEGLAAGADDYLVKPFSARELRARIDGAVTLSRSRRAASERERDLRAEIVLQQGKAVVRDTEQRLAYALEAGRLGSWTLDLRRGLLEASDICRDNLGIAPDAPAMMSYHEVFARVVHPQDLDALMRAVSQAIETRSDLDAEFRVIKRFGEIFWSQIRGHATYDADGTPAAMAGISLDITARKLSERRQMLLLDELNHRVKNTLATVQSIAIQTQRGAKTPAAFTEDLAARIAALARAHDLLTHTSWEGAMLADVVDRTREILDDAAEDSQRIEAKGPAVRLGPNAAVTLNMAFHELATNAVKYGALSTEQGRVGVEWKLDFNEGGGVLDIVWREYGGPAVQPPTRRGFGSRLIERGVANELDGKVRLQFDEDGVRCHMSFPLSSKVMAVT